MLLLEAGLRHEGAEWIGADSRAAAGRRPALFGLAIGAVCALLGAAEGRVQRIHDELPVSPDREAMLEHRVAYDVTTEIVGTIECVVADQLRPAVESLEAASRVTAEELREQHREQQALLRRLRGRMRDEIG